MIQIFEADDPLVVTGVYDIYGFTEKERRRMAKREPKVQGDWGRFLQERHLLILDWVAEGKSFEEIAGIFSMDPTQVQLISMTPFDMKRFARAKR